MQKVISTGYMLKHLTDWPLQVYFSQMTSLADCSIGVAIPNL